MSDISTLKNIRPDEVAKLRDANITTREQLWDVVDEKRELGIAEIVLNAGISKDRLIELLEADALDEAQNLGVPQEKTLRRFLGLAFSGLRRHWLDVAVLVTFLVVLVLVVHAVRGHRAGYSTQVVLTAPGGLPAYHAITRNDVTLRQTRSVAGSLGKVEDAIGRYAIAPIAEGTALRAEQLKSDPALLAELNGRSILQLSVRVGGPEPELKPPLRVSLLLAPRSDAKGIQPAVLKDVLLLATGREGDSTWASVALLPDQLAALGSLLGSADVFVVRPAP